MTVVSYNAVKLFIPICSKIQVFLHLLLKPNIQDLFCCCFIAVVVSCCVDCQPVLIWWNLERPADFCNEVPTLWSTVTWVRALVCVCVCECLFAWWTVIPSWGKWITDRKTNCVPSEMAIWDKCIYFWMCQCCHFVSPRPLLHHHGKRCGRSSFDLNGRSQIWVRANTITIIALWKK